MGRGSRTTSRPAWQPSSEHLPKQIIKDGISCDPRAAEELARRGIDISEIPLPSVSGLQTTLFYLGPGKIEIRSQSANDEEILLDMICQIDLNKGSAHHESLHIGDNLRGQNIGKDLLRQQIDWYQEIGIRQIELFANSELGGYFWARAGFCLPSKEHGLVVRKIIEASLNELAELRRGVEDLRLDSLALAIEDIHLCEELLSRNQEDVDLQEIAALRPSVRLSEESRRDLEKIQAESQVARDLLRLRGEDDGYLSGKTILLGSGWGGVLKLDDPRQMAICREYLRN